MNSKTLLKKKDNLYLILCGIFLTNALLAEIIGVKIFSLEATLGFPEAQLPLLNGKKLDFNLTAGVIIWPVVFIISDVINEYFGVKGVKKISYLTATFIIYAFIIIYFATTLSPSSVWLKPYNYDINEAYSAIFIQSLGIILGSLIAFLVGQLIDAYTFKYLKKITGSKKIWLRATGSTLVSQLVDSFVVLIIAFYVFGKLPLSFVVSIAIVNYIYKFIIAILLTPVLYAIHFLIDNYLSSENK